MDSIDPFDQIVADVKISTSSRLLASLPVGLVAVVGDYEGATVVADQELCEQLTDAVSSLLDQLDLEQPVRVKMVENVVRHLLPRNSLTPADMSELYQLVGLIGSAALELIDGMVSTPSTSGSIAEVMTLAEDVMLDPDVRESARHLVMLSLLSMQLHWILEGPLSDPNHRGFI